MISSVRTSIKGLVVLALVVCTGALAVLLAGCGGGGAPGASSVAANAYEGVFYSQVIPDGYENAKNSADTFEKTLEDGKVASAYITVFGSPLDDIVKMELGDSLFHEAEPIDAGGLHWRAVVSDEWVVDYYIAAVEDGCVEFTMINMSDEDARAFLNGFTPKEQPYETWAREADSKSVEGTSNDATVTVVPESELSRSSSALAPTSEQASTSESTSTGETPSESASSSSSAEASSESSSSSATTSE